MSDNVKFKNFSAGISRVFSTANMNPNQVAKQLGEDPALIHKITKGKQSASNRIQELFLTIPELVNAGLSAEVMHLWKVKDKFPELENNLQLKVLEKLYSFSTFDFCKFFLLMSEKSSELQATLIKTECPDCGHCEKFTLKEVEDNLQEIVCSKCGSEHHVEVEDLKNKYDLFLEDLLKYLNSAYPASQERVAVAKRQLSRRQKP